MTLSLSQPALAPRAGEAPQSIVVFLHGLGAHGRDLLPLGHVWADALPRTLFIAPDAPEPCDMAPGMPQSYQWFSLQDRDPAALLAGVQRAAPLVQDFLERLLAQTGVAPARLALVGFSQGTMLSLQIAPRFAPALAGVVGYSGALIDDGTLAAAPARPPIFLAHGDADMVVPFTALAYAQGALQAAGFAVDALHCPGVGHGIDDAALRAGGAFLKRVLG